MIGTIAMHPTTKRLCINGERSTQKGLTLRQTCIDEFDLKEGDKVHYDGMLYSTVFVIRKIENPTN